VLQFKNTCGSLPTKL